MPGTCHEAHLARICCGFTHHQTDLADPFCDSEARCFGATALNSVLKSVLDAAQRECMVE